MNTPRTREYGFVPIENSLVEYMKYFQVNERGKTFEGIDPFWASLRVGEIIAGALAFEDEALSMRSGHGRFIFHFPQFMAPNLESARAEAAIIYDEYGEYCSRRGIDPLETMVNNYHERQKAKRMLEYAKAVNCGIKEGLKREGSTQIYEK